MGEIADAMLAGAMCEVCGEFFGDCDTPPGYPRVCLACGGDPDAVGGVEMLHETFEREDKEALFSKPHVARALANAAASSGKYPCPLCGKRVKACGLENHIVDKHIHAADA